MSSENTRTGLRIRSDSQVHSSIKNECLKFGKWLRSHFTFPIRVVVYLKKENRIINQDKELVTATFLGPYNKNEEPYIRIATGDYEDIVLKYGKNKALFSILSSFAHELIHYHQWLEDAPFDENEAVQESEKLLERYFDFFVEEKNKEVENLKETPTQENLKKLYARFEQGFLDIQLSIIESLSSFTNFKCAKKWLIDLTKHKSYKVRYYAIESLSYFEGEEVIRNIIRSLQDPNAMVRVFGAQALGYIGDNTALPFLIPALWDSNYLVRGFAAVAIGYLGNKDYISLLEKALEEEKSKLSKLRIYVGLYYLGEKSCLEYIWQFLNSRSPKIRLVTIFYITEIAENEGITIAITEKLYRRLEIEKNKEVKSALYEALVELRIIER